MAGSTVRSKRYQGSPLPSGPSAGKAASALGDPRGSGRSIVKGGRGSVKRRKVSKGRARGRR